MTNLEIDSLFPVAVVIALASGGVYRVTHRRLQPSAFLEIRELSFGIGEGCVLALAIGSLLHVLFATSEPYATQLVMAVIVTRRHHHDRPHAPALLPPRADDHPGPRRRGGHHGRPHHAQRPPGRGMTLVGRIVDHENENENEAVAVA